jgi:CBS domain-containing protein
MFVRVSALVQEELASAIVRNPLVVPPDMTVMEAIAQMSGIRTLCQTSNEASDHINVEIDAHSSCVVIVENNQPVGIFTERDVVRLITQKADLENLPIRDDMTRDLITLPESELSDIFVALELLRQHKICHLPILDEQGGLVGLLTHGSLRQISSQVDLLRSQRQQAVIASMALHIQRAHTFEAVSNTIVQEIRSFLDADRAIIYRFNPDMSGEIVAEAVISPWESFLNTQIEDTCFRENLGGEYQKGKVFAANDIYKANLTECHIQLLERFQVKANLVAPILLNGK